MPYSSVENDAFRPRDDDDPECARLLNGLWAEDTDPPHCQRCALLIRSCRPRLYPTRDHTGRIIVSDFVLMA